MGREAMEKLKGRILQHDRDTRAQRPNAKPITERAAHEQAQRAAISGDRGMNKDRGGERK